MVPIVQICDNDSYDFWLLIGEFRQEEAGWTCLNWLQRVAVATIEICWGRIVYASTYSLYDEKRSILISFTRNTSVVLGLLSVGVSTIYVKHVFRS